MAKKDAKNEKKQTLKKDSLLVTKESLSATFILFSAIALFVLCTRGAVFGELGLAMHSFLVGMFGYLAYPVTVGVLYWSVTAMIGKRLVKDRRMFLCGALAFVCAALVVHTALTLSWEREGYILACLNAGESFPASTVSGWVGGIIVYSVSTILSMVGTIVLFSVLALLFGYLCASSLLKPSKKETKKIQKTVEQVPTVVKVPQPAPTQPTVEQRPGVQIQEETRRSNMSRSDGFSPFGAPTMMQQPLQRQESATPMPENSRDILFGRNPAENYRTNLIFDPNSNANRRPYAEPTKPVTEYMPSYSEAYQRSVNEEKSADRPIMIMNDNVTDYREERAFANEYEEKPEILEIPDFADEKPTPLEAVDFKEEPSTFNFGREESKTEDSVIEVGRVEPKNEPYKRHDYMELFSRENPRLFADSDESSLRGREELFSGREDRAIPESRDDFTARGFVDEPRDRLDGRGEEERGRGDRLNIFDEKEDDPYSLRSDFEVRGEERGRGETETRSLGFGDRDLSSSIPVEPVKKPEPVKQPDPPKPRVIKPYKRVPLDDFDCRDIEPTQNEEEVEETKQNIIATLEDFKVTGATIASVTFGPTVTRYNVALPRSVSPRKIVSLDQSIAISLHSKDVNIYPNYEDGVVSIEVPNKERQFVKLGCMLSGNTFVNAPQNSLTFAMGKNVANAKIYGDITKMIHMLVAGSSGSGKSVFLGSLIISLIYKYSPEELRLILIDPKKTEFVLYNNLPHLMINEIITDANKAVQSLNWAIGEMNRRYGLFEQMSRAGQYVVNLDEYNSKLEKSKRLPKIVIIIDELADLMLAAKKEMEDRIQNLTQKARAAGIHLIVATQRPSTDVITGVIKSNLATRIAFYVASDVDSRVILDQTGAQKLLGKGDLLYTMPGVNTPVRVQSAFISPEESQKVVNFIKANNEAYYDEEATAYINNTRTSDDTSLGGDKSEVDPMYIEALRHVILSGSASISMIQRKCSAGYNRAGRIIEWMEDMGYISAFDGAKARKVLITKEEFENKYGPL